MSDRPRVGTALLTSALCVVLAGSAAAQSPTVREQQARVERLARLRAAADSDWQKRRARELASWKIDTIAAGPVTIVTRAENGPVVRSGALEAWQAMAPAFRGDSALLRDPWFYIQVGTKESYGFDLRTYATHALRGGTVRETSDDRPDVALLVRQLVAGSLAEKTDGPFREWVGGHVPMAYDSATLRNVYVELVTRPSQIAHQCFLGEVQACRVALELDSVPDPAAAWFGPAERELLVHDIGMNYTSRTAGTRWDTYTRCLEQHDDWSCLAYLRSVPRYVLRLPLSQVARESLVRTALALGGAGAYTRLTRAGGTARDRVAAAAQLPLDSVVGVWHRQVLAARPPAERPSAGTQWSTLFWVAVMATLALRSTRWRSA